MYSNIVNYVPEEYESLTFLLNSVSEEVNEFAEYLNVAALRCKVAEFTKIKYLYEVSKLILIDCDITDLTMFKLVNTLILIRCNNIKEIPELEYMRELTVFECNNLSKLPTLKHFDFIYVSKCPNINKISTYNSKCIKIEYIPGLTDFISSGYIDVMSIESCPNIEHLYIDICDTLYLTNCDKLQEIEINYCKYIELDTLYKINEIRAKTVGSCLSIYDCATLCPEFNIYGDINYQLAVENVSGLKNLILHGHIKDITIDKCVDLESVQYNIENNEEFDVSNCPKYISL